MDADISQILEVNRYITQVLTGFGDWGGIGVFVSTLLFGEAAIFVSFLFSEQGKISFGEVFIFSFCAVWCADAFWFLVGRYFPKSRIPAFLKSPALGQVSTLIQTVTKNRLMLSLVVLKFFIGARIAYMLYLGQQGAKIRDVLTYNIVAVFVLVSTLSILGRISGHYIQSTFSSYQAVASLLFGALFLLVVFSLTRILLKKTPVPQ